MRQRALLLIAAVSLQLSAAAQTTTHYVQQLNLVKSYDVTNINKTTSHRIALNEVRSDEKQVQTPPRLSPNLDLPSLKKQLSTDMRFLKLEQKNQQWQGIFQGLIQGATSKGKPAL